MQNDEIINVEQALERVLGHKEMYKKWLDRFFVPQTLEDVRISFSEKDYDKAHFALHKLKGTAANLSINTLSDCAIDLDYKIKAKEPFDELSADLQKVIEEYERAETFYRDNTSLFI